jgi:hypothetical protein
MDHKRMMLGWQQPKGGDGQRTASTESQPLPAVLPKI